MNTVLLLFGGTFDPIHKGHTIVASATADALCAEKVFFIPARCSPHRPSGPHADDAHRAEMIRMAIADQPRMELSTCELERPEPSYTVDTVLEFRREYGGDAQIHWAVGADQVPELPRWYRIHEIVDACNLCIMYRGGYEKPNLDLLEDSLGADRVQKLKRHVIATPLVDIQSSEIRRKLAAGEDVGSMVSPEVLAYIYRNNLYQAPK